MSKIYTSTSANKWGIVEKGNTVEYSEKKNHSCLVLVIGILLVIAIGLFIFKHWDTESLLLASLLYPGQELDNLTNEESDDKTVAIVIAVVIALVIFPISFVL